MNIFFFLVFHIVGLVMMAGTTLVDFLFFSQFWKLYAADKRGGAAILVVQSRFRLLLMTGFILLLLSGVSMVALSHGLFAEQRWFRIKMGIIVLLFLNAMVFGRRQVMKLRTLTAADIAGGDVQLNLSLVKGRLQLFHILQVLMFLTVFTLSIYKFN